MERWSEWPPNRLYEASDQGRIRSWVPRNGVVAPAVLRLNTKPNGYQHIALIVDGVRKTFSVHRVVLDAFVGPRPRGLECRHLNGNPGDNRLENIQWGTKSENARDKKLHDPMLQVGERHAQAKLTSRLVREILLADGSQADIASRFGITQSNVCSIRTGKTWGHVYKDVVREHPTIAQREHPVLAGERNGCAKLTEDDVRAILALPRSVTHREIARQYGVTYGLVGHIRRGIAWKHIPREAR